MNNFWQGFEKRAEHYPSGKYNCFFHAGMEALNKGGKLMRGPAMSKGETAHFWVERNGEIIDRAAKMRGISYPHYHRGEEISLERNIEHLKNDPMFKKQAFRSGFEKRAILLAGGMHLLQNAGMKRLLSHTPFGVSVGQHFTKGLLGQTVNPVKRFFGSLVSGASIPETHAMRTHAYELGEKVREGLRSHGINKLSPEALNAMQQALQEGPRVLKTSKDPHVQVLDKVLAGHPWFSSMEGSVEGLDKVYHSPQNPLLSNIAKNLIQPATATSHILPEAVHMGRKADLAGGVVGSVASAVADLPTGIMNTFKSVATNPSARGFFQKFGPTRKALGWVDKTFVTKPVTKSFEAGQSLKPLGAAREFARTNLVNPVVGSAVRTANRVGMVSSTAPTR